MSRKRPWYKRFPDLFIAGTVGLTFEQKTTYSFLLDLIYANNGALPDDDLWISRTMGCNARRWKRLKQELIAAGKLAKFPQTSPNFGETLRNVFANSEIESAKIKHLAGHRKKKKKKKREERSSLKARDLSSPREASLASPHERLATPRAQAKKQGRAPPQAKPVKMSREEGLAILEAHNASVKNGNA